MTEVVPRPLKQEQLPASDEILEIAPGVLRAQLPISIPGLGHVNMYILEDERGVTLVDPGLPEKVVTKSSRNDSIKSVFLSSECIR